jgi:hypothetical protein
VKTKILPFYNTGLKEIITVCLLFTLNLLGVAQPPVQSMHLVFEEEFDSPETAIDWEDTREPGFSFYRVRPFGWPNTPFEAISIENGVLTLQEATRHANYQISTIAGKDSDSSWTGFVPALEDGGLYFEAAIAFDPFYLDNNPEIDGFPAFWTLSAEHLYPHFPVPYEIFENDFLEYNPSWAGGNKECYFHILHHYNIPEPGTNHLTSLPYGQAKIESVQTEWGSFNVFGVLWVPDQGVKTYLNGELFRSVSLEDFPLLATADNQHFPVILGSGQWPMHVDWVRVWQYASDDETDDITNDSVCMAQAAPIIDGIDENYWEVIEADTINKVTIGEIASTEDLFATYKTTWDETNLYLLVNVTDNTKHYEPGTYPWNDDAIELFIDGNNDKSTSFDDNDHQYIFRWNDTIVYKYINATAQPNNPAGVVCKQSNTSSGYVMEIQIAWDEIGITPSADKPIGFDILVDDDDDGGALDKRVIWYATVNNISTNYSLLGTVVPSSTCCEAEARNIDEEVINGGVVDEGNEPVVSIFPNPSNGSICVNISPTVTLSNAIVRIFDNCGKEVGNISVNNHEKLIQTNELMSGIYFFMLINNNEVIENNKLIINKKDY